MFNTDRYFTPLDQWLMRHFFQAFSDYTHHKLGLSNFFWTGCCLAIAAVAMLYKGYRGLFIEGDPMMILALAVGFLIYFPILIGQVKRIWYVAYDDAMYGLENTFGLSSIKLRASTLSLTFLVSIAWVAISIRNDKVDISTLVLWIFMTHYPMFAFSSCNAPGRRF